MTIRRFAEVSWTRQGPTRYFSVLATPMLVAVLAPGFWWAPCALGALVGIFIDLRAHRSFQRLCARLDELEDSVLQAAIHRHVWVSAWLTVFYVMPYALLAFAPQPTPIVGLLFCAGSALIAATLHVMTRNMILYTAPPILLGLMSNAFTFGDGGVDSWALAIMAGLLGLNAIIAARAGAVIFSDLIGARMKAEQAAAELEQRVQERTAELGVATRRAQAANRAKSLFLANMSHELRTPLNAVIGYSEIIEEDLASGETRTSAADLQKIRAAAGHLLTLINEVLDLSRIEAGKLELRATHFDLPAMLRSALDTVRPTAAKNRNVCQINVAPGVGDIFTDETRLRQCLLNLLSNAAKFTTNGVIALDARPCRIGVEAGVAITVRDTGSGISAENLARLFQPFVQADNAKTRTHDGAGLGLVITRRLARAMGGDVQASSVLGEGSTFTLYLPLRPAQIRAAAA